MQVALKKSSCVYVPLFSLASISATVLLRMPEWFYAVGRGRQVGVYTSWAECQKQINNISNAKYRKFKTQTEADNFIQECKEKYSPFKPPLETRSKNLSATAMCPTIESDISTTSSQSSRTRSVKPTLSRSLFYSQTTDIASASESMFLSQREKGCNNSQVSKSHAQSRAVSPQTLLALESLAENDPFLPESSEGNSQKTSSTDPSEVSAISRFMERFEGHFANMKGTLDHILQKINNMENEIQKLSDQNATTNRRVQNQNATVSGVKRSLLENYNIPQPVGRNFSTAQEEDREIEVVPVPRKKIPKVELNSDEEVDGFNYDFKVNENGYVIVYTDGACENNGKHGAKAGIGVWFGDNHPLNSSEPVHGRPTNNTAEIQATVKALKTAKSAGVKKIVVNTDSEFTINCVTKWVHKWMRNNWKVASGANVKNKEDLILLLDAMENLDVKWEHVRGHQGIHGNEMADRLARSGAERYRP